MKGRWKNVQYKRNRKEMAKILGERISELLKKRGMQQKDLANIIGTKQIE